MCKPNWSAEPNSAEMLSKIRWRYCMSVNFYLVGTGQGQDQVTKAEPNSAEMLSKIRWRYCMSVNFYLVGTGQGQDQVTKGHYYIQKSHLGHVIHVLKAILAIEFDGFGCLIVSYHFQELTAKARSKSGHIVNFLKFIHIEENVCLDYLLLSKLVVSFGFRATSRRFKNCIWKSYVINKDKQEGKLRFVPKNRISSLNLVHWLMTANCYVSYLSIFLNLNFVGNLEKIRMKIQNIENST